MVIGFHSAPKYGSSRAASFAVSARASNIVLKQKLSSTFFPDPAPRSTAEAARRDFRSKAIWAAHFSASGAPPAHLRRGGQILSDGWRVLTVWECALRGKAATSATEVVAAVKTWLESSQKCEEIPR